MKNGDNNRSHLIRYVLRIKWDVIYKVLSTEYVLNEHMCLLVLQSLTVSPSYNWTAWGPSRRVACPSTPTEGGPDLVHFSLPGSCCLSLPGKFRAGLSACFSDLILTNLLPFPTTLPGLGNRLDSQEAYHREKKKEAASRCCCTLNTDGAFQSTWTRMGAR